MKRGSGRGKRTGGWLEMDLAMAAAVLLLAFIPLATSIGQERKMARTLYYRAVAMGIVDGEMEILRAGEWRAFGAGEHEYPIRAESASQLPEGVFLLDRGERTIRLSWEPQAPWRGSRVVREFPLDAEP